MDSERVIMLAPSRNSTSRVQSGPVALLTRATKVRVLFCSSADKHTTWSRELEDRVPVIKFALTDGKRRTNTLFPKVRHISRKISTPLLSGATQTFHSHGPAEEASSKAAADRKIGTVARCCVTEIQGGIQGPVEPPGAPRGRNQTRTGWKFPFRTDGNFATPCFAFHTSAHDAAVSGEGVEIFFLVARLSFRFDCERCCSCSWSFFSLALCSHSFVRFAVLYALFTRPIPFRTLTYTAVVLALSHTPRAWDTPLKKPSIHQKETSNPSHHHPSTSKKPPTSKNPPKCPPSAPSSPPTAAPS